MYERSQYAYDRREWVKRADALLPGLREEAAARQRSAAGLFASLQQLHYPWLQEMVSEEYGGALRALSRVLYYEGMRRANADS